MQTLKIFIEKSAKLDRESKLLINGGGGCTGGGFTKITGGWKSWDGDCTDDRGYTTYHGLRYSYD